MSDRQVANPTAARVVLGSLGVIQLANGLLALLAPHNFYTQFPAGRGWVAAYPAYSEHLVRDVGGLWLGTAVLLLCAAVWPTRRLVLITAGAWLMSALPHAIYHAATYDHLSGGDAFASMAGLTAMVLLPLWLVVSVLRERGTQPRAAAPPAPTTARVALPDRPKGLVARATYRESRRRYGTVAEPAKAMTHTPLLLTGYGALEMAAERSDKAPTRLKELAVMRAAMVVGCEWCLDFGTAHVLAAGITEDELKDLANYATSPRFDETDRLVLDYATAMTRTPAEPTDELVASLRERLGDPALVELTTMVALENMRARMNDALGLGAQGFSEGSYCVAPEAAATPAATTA